MELTEEQLDFLKRAAPGNAAIYQLVGDQVKTLYLAPKLHLLNGMTSEEYTAMTESSASNAVLPEDLPGLMAAVRACVKTDEPLNYFYRVVHKTAGFDWVHANARCCGELNGLPVVMAIYSNASVETDVYQAILDHSESVIFVCDCHTHELLYANRAAVRYRDSVGADFTGNACFYYIRGRDEPCPDCVMDKRNQGPLNVKRFDSERGTWEHIAGEFVTWCGHDAFVHYIDDITESEKKQAELKNILSAEENLVHAIQLVNGTKPIGERLDEVFRTIGEYYGADRAYLFELEPDHRSGNNTVEWCRPDVAPQKDFLQHVDVNYIARWMPYFQRHEPVVTADVEEIRDTNPDEYDILCRQNIRSYLEAPLVIDDTFYGFIGVDNPSPESLEHAGGLLLSLAYAISNAIQRARNEQVLLDARHRYEAAVEGADLGVWEYHIKEHRLTNPNARFLRYHVPDVVDNFPAALFPKVLESDREKLRQIYRRVDAGEPVVSGDIWMKWLPESPPVCERIIYSVQKDESGAPAVAYGISIDVTAQKQEQAKFHRTMQAMLSANPDALGTIQVNLTKNQCGEGHSASQFMEATTRAKNLDELIGVVSQLIPSQEERLEFLSRFSCEKLLECFRSGQTYLQFEYRRNGEKGKPFWMRTYIRMLQNPENGDVEGVMYSLDISREKQMNDIFRVITDREYDLIALVHTDTALVEALHLGASLPQPYRDLLPFPGATYPLEDFRRNAIEQWLNPDDRENYRMNSDPEYYRPIMDRTGRFEFTLREHFPDKGETSRRFQHYYLSGDRSAILVMESDVTEAARLQKKELEQERYLRRQATAANAAKSEFLSRMSHDIRTPLNGIIGMTHIARQQENSPRTADCLNKIDTSSQFLLGLVNDILDMTKAESGEVVLHPQPYRIEDFRAYLNAVIRPLCEEKHQDFLVETPPEPIETVPLMDILRVNQIYFNLLSNAVKYTPEGGAIRCRVEYSIPKEGRIRIRTGVTDNGIGISPAFQKVIFEPFTQEWRDDTSDRRGSGLGLAIAKKMVDLMHGVISVQSEVGKGTAFLVECEYDCVPSTAVAQAQKTEADYRRLLQGRRVLLCEDHPLNQEIARAILAEDGVECDTAKNGAEGVDLFRGSKPGYYDAILMDIRMPVLNGYEATSAIRRLPRPDAASVPIIAMTADAFSDDVQRCLDAGMSGHIAKPIDPDQMFRTIASALR